ncbi:hypothetical protein [Stigmatella aurantiaca]|nr:hypothetical protein [Stigmatella aurantiaca]
MDNNQTQPTEQDTQNTEQELTDEQLLQMAEGSCTWGANCGK